MNRPICTIAVAAIICLSLATGARAASIDELNALMDSVRIVEGDVFAPKTYEKAAKKADEARQSSKLGKKQKQIDKLIAEATEYAENALRATEVAKLSLNQYLPPRDKARAAQAYIHVPELYNKAEEQFIKGTERVESGNVKDGLKEADKAISLFDAAELEAIKVDIMSSADKLIAAAVADEADKYSLSTLDKARTARAAADNILNKDRYNRDDAVRLASLAEYEARHASSIAQSVRSLNRNDQAWEKLMLVYEIQMNRVGAEMGANYLPFDRGPIAAADSLILYIRDLKARLDKAQKTDSQVAANLTKTLSRLNPDLKYDRSVELSEALDQQVAEIKGEVSQLSEEIASEKDRASQLEAAHEQTSAELESRLANEQRFKKAKRLLNPSEGEVLFNSSNDIVLRLSGLSFDIGKSDIKDEHIKLLGKVQEVIEMFPDSRLVVEGHTDASGEPAANTLLSEKRAFAVMQYLRQAILIPADRIRAIGYGSEKPIASNQSAEGRAKNRRIDIIIMH